MIEFKLKVRTRPGSIIGPSPLCDQAHDLNDMPLVLAVMAVIVAIGLAIDRVVFGPFEGWIHSRWGISR